jgi:hypothetical protein
LLETVHSFQKSTLVFLLMQPPEMTDAVFRRAQRSSLAIPMKDVMNTHRDEYELFKAFGGLTGVKVIDSKAALCDRETCRTRADGILLYSDNNHLSDAGVNLVWDMVRRETGK